MSRRDRPVSSLLRRAPCRSLRWVPPAYEVPNEARFDWVREIEPGLSVTALEIHHGVLRNPEMKHRAVFFFRASRQPQSTDSTPEAEQLGAKLLELKQIIRRDCEVIDYDSPNSDFVNLAVEQLWRLIDREYPQGKTQPRTLTSDRIAH